MKTIYLVGPISGCSYKGCAEWREVLTPELEELGFNVFSPIHGEVHLRRKKNISSFGTDEVLTSHAIVARDKFYVMSSDILLVNFLGAQRVSIGSIMEMGWAYMSNKLIITVMEKTKNLHDHAFIREVTTLMCPSLEEAKYQLAFMFKGKDAQQLFKNHS